MKVLIIGSSSFVGKNLIKKFKTQKKIKVYGCDISNSNNSKFIKADITKKDFYKKLPKKLDVIIHLAAVSRDQDCSKDLFNCYNINVNGTLNVIDAAEKLNIKNIIFASTEWVYDNDLAKKGASENSMISLSKLNSDYAKSKLISENHLKSYYQSSKKNITILRFGIIYGERMENWSAVEALFNTVKNKSEITIGSKKTSRKFIHIDDISLGIIKSLKLKKFNIINLQGIKLINLNNIISNSKKILKKNIKIFEKDPTKPSIRNIKSFISNKKIGFKPKITLLEGLKRLEKYINSN